MGELTVLRGVAGVTGIIGFDNRLAARCTGDMTGVTADIVCCGMVVMGEG